MPQTHQARIKSRLRSPLLQAVLVLSIGTAIAQGLIFPLLQDKILAPLQQWEIEYLSKGSIEILAQRLLPLPSKQRKEALQKLQAQFGFDIALKDSRLLALPRQDIERLQAFEVVGEASTYSAYRLLENSHQAIQFKGINSSASHLANDAQRRHMGTLHLLTQALQTLPPQEQQQKLAALSVNFDYPLQLLQRQELTLSAKQISLLDTGTLLTVATKESARADYPADYAYQKLGDFYLMLGPFSPPTLQRFYSLQIVYFLLFGIIILLPLLLWLIPTWRSNRNLYKATSAFGRGNYNARATPVKGSNANQMVNVFNHMAAEIQSRVETNKAMINSVSHELRTPVSRIEFHLELAAKDAQTEAQKRQLSGIENSVDELKTLINEMLMYARFDQEKPTLNIETININEWLNSERKNYLSIDKRATIKIHCAPESLQVSLDRYYMSRCLGNLVRNAQRAAKESIVIETGISDGFITLSVSDDGPGIAVSARARIFEPFVRLDNSRNRDAGGSGLGLAIVKQIISWHAGEVWVEDSTLGGARFVLRWPQTIHTENKA